jgi:hypothetical protein
VPFELAIAHGRYDEPMMPAAVKKSNCQYLWIKIF